MNCFCFIILLFVIDVNLVKGQSEEWVRKEEYDLFKIKMMKLFEQNQRESIYT